MPLIVDVGALRTSWAQQLARDAERAGADGLLLAPMSYTPLTSDEATSHYGAVTSVTGLPLCIYDNPSTTRFTFTPELIERLTRIAGVAALKAPLPSEGDYAGQIADLRDRTPAGFSVGNSGDWSVGSSLLAGGRLLQRRGGRPAPAHAADRGGGSGGRRRGGRQARRGACAAVGAAARARRPAGQLRRGRPARPCRVAR